MKLNGRHALLKRPDAPSRQPRPPIGRWTGMLSALSLGLVALAGWRLGRDDLPAAFAALNGALLVKCAENICLWLELRKRS